MGGFQTLAKFLRAMHGKSRLSAIQKDFEMRTPALHEGRALLFQPLLHLLRIHIKRITYVLRFVDSVTTQGMTTTAMLRTATASSHPSNRAPAHG